MEEQLERANAAPELRAIADALGPLGDEPAPSQLALADGTVVRVEVKPGETAREAAERLYSSARSMERALEQLPARIAALEREQKDLAALLASAELYAEDPVRAETAQMRYVQIDDELLAALERWETLERQ
jgi:ATP-binding cassette subfamily F protein uup